MRSDYISIAMLATATARTSARREPLATASFALGASGVSEGVLDAWTDVVLVTLWVRELYFEETDSSSDETDGTSEAAGVTLGGLAGTEEVAGLVGTGYVGGAGVMLVVIGGGGLSDGGYRGLLGEGCSGW